MTKTNLVKKTLSLQKETNDKKIRKAFFVTHLLPDKFYPFLDTFQGLFGFDSR